MENNFSTIQYTPAFEVDDSNPLQQKLNYLYDYSNTNDADTQYCHRLRLNMFHELLTGMIADGTIQHLDHALDIGANAGTMSKMASEAGFKDVWGIDIDDVQLNKAIARFEMNANGQRIHFENFDAELIPDDKKFDLIICSEVIEHTTRPLKIIESIKRGLKPGGVAIISLPNVMSLGYFLTWLGYKIKGRAMGQYFLDHLKWPSYRTLREFDTPDVKIIRTAGVNMLYWHGYKFVKFIPVFNRFNYWLGKVRPFSRFGQFFFLVVQK